MDSETSIFNLSSIYNPFNSLEYTIMYNNNCTFAGRIGQIKPAAFSAKGTKIINFTLAISKSVKDAHGNFSDQTSWVNCTAFGSSADYLESKTKGSYIGISCELQTRKYNDGKADRTVTEFIVNRAESLPPYWTKDAGSNQHHQSNQQHPSQHQQRGAQHNRQPVNQPVNQNAHQQMAEPDFDDDGMPF